MDYLYSFSKYDYVKSKKKADYDCIICEILKNNDKLDNLIVYSSSLVSVSINLYPYNSAHLLIFPNRHITDIRELLANEENEITFLLKKSLDIIDELYKPSGYNFGYNMGTNSGASIAHIHQHIIPRYPNELGLADLIGGAKVMIEDPRVTKERLKERFDKIRKVK